MGNDLTIFGCWKGEGPGGRSGMAEVAEGALQGLIPAAIYELVWKYFTFHYFND